MGELAVDKSGLQIREKLEEMSQTASRIKSSVSEAVEDNVHSVRRSVRRGWHSAHDLVDNAAYKVKRHPFKAVGITAGAAFVSGLLAGLTARGDGRLRKPR